MRYYSRAKDQLFQIGYYIRGAFWAIPAALLTLAVLLAFLSAWLDQTFQQSLGFTLSTQAEGNEGFDIESLLSTTAAAILGVAGVSFSVTITSLTLASQQFGPRLIRNFVEDRFTQTVLGFFVATFLFCMMSLQVTQVMASSDQYAPTFTLIITLVLMIIDLFLLVLFIHHICVSISADAVINDVFKELRERIAILQPNDDTGTSEPPNIESLKQEGDKIKDQGLSISAWKDGYIQHIDTESLVDYAEQHDLQIAFAHRPGDYVLCRTTLAYVKGKAVPDDAQETISNSVGIEYARSPRQDLEHCIRQLVEIALRALSPGVNDPFTAMTCIDRLGTGLSEIANRPAQSPDYCDANGRLRVLVFFTDYPGLVDAAFNQIRQTAKGHTDVTIRLLEIINKIIDDSPSEQQAKSLLNQARLIHDATCDSSSPQYDQDAIEARYDKILGAMGQQQDAKP